jgi:hypothetical protein
MSALASMYAAGYTRYRQSDANIPDSNTYTLSGMYTPMAARYARALTS